MVAKVQDRVLVVDDNPIFRSTLADYLRAAGVEVITAATGEQAFNTLRDCSGGIGWLYTRATLPRMIDGWILADEFHNLRPNRRAIISTVETGSASAHRIVLTQPTPAAVLELLLTMIEQARTGPAAADSRSGHQQAA